MKTIKYISMRVLAVAALALVFAMPAKAQCGNRHRTTRQRNPLSRYGTRRHCATPFAAVRRLYPRKIPGARRPEHEILEDGRPVQAGLRRLVRTAFRTQQMKPSFYRNSSCFPHSYFPYRRKKIRMTPLHHYCGKHL